MGRLQAAREEREQETKDVPRSAEKSVAIQQALISTMHKPNNNSEKEYSRAGEEGQEAGAAVAAGVDEAGEDSVKDEEDAEKAVEKTVVAASADDTL